MLLKEVSKIKQIIIKQGNILECLLPVIVLNTGQGKNNRLFSLH